MNEVAVTALLCLLLNGGETEVRHDFTNLGESRGVRIDCETPTHVIEVGLDNTSSARDSIHQAVFASLLTGKQPMVVIIDRDGQEGRYEYELRRVAAALEIPYGTCSMAFIQRWAATAPWRDAIRIAGANDLPPPDIAARHCNLAGQFDLPLLN